LEKAELEKKEKEYERLVLLEQETTKLRYTTFTAVLSVSFVLPGLAANAEARSVSLFVLTATVKQLVFLLGYIFYLFAVFHYAWYHRYSHKYRKALKDLETQLGIKVYTLRVRPQIGPFKLHFDWALYLIGLVYGLITAIVVGWCVFLASLASIAVLYAVLSLLSFWQPTEPLE
jgi:sterol desaturase/sphingolipid hydroxylase (fatty acid hydroxylase superfamily)